MEEINILYIDTCLDVAGGQRSLMALLSSLPENVKFKILINEKNKKYRNELKNNGVSDEKILAVDTTLLSSNFLGGVRVFLKTFKTLLSDKIDIIHCNTFFDGVFGSLAGRVLFKPTIFRARCGIDLSNHGIADNIIYMLSSLVLANSSYVKSTFKRVDSSLKKVKVIFNPLDKKFISNRVAESSEIAIIGVVGAITEVKNQKEVLHAFLNINRNDIKIRFIGEPRSTVRDKLYMEELVDLVNIHDLNERVEFTGFLSDVRDRMNDLAMICVPSDREPLGRVIFESQLYGIPVLASKSGGNRELITDGETGYLYTLGDIEELTRKMIFACRDNRLLVKNARENILSLFSPEKTSIAEIKTYYQLCGKVYK